MIWRDGNFIINGQNGIADLHAVIENLPEIPQPQRKRTLTDIIGSNEKIILDENAYENRDITLNIAMQAINEEDRVMRLSALYAAFDSSTYIDFSYYGEPNVTYKVITNGSTTPKRIAHGYDMRLSFKLSAKAFKYYNPDESIAVSGSIATFNRFNYSSRPLIHFGNSGNSTIRINNTTYYFGPLPSGGAWVDCEESQQDVYNGNTLVDNAFPLSQEFPSIPPGKVTISSTNATVYPRWRTI